MAESSKTVAQQVANELSLSGDYWPVIIQAFIGLSQPLRRSLQNYLQSQKVYYNQVRGKFNYLAQRGDGLAVKLQQLTTILNTVLEPLTSFFNMFPVDSTLKAIPEFSEVMEGLSQNVPLKVPTDIATQISGIAGFDFLEGVSSFQDLRDKVDELTFRASRATSLSNYSSKATYMVDLQIDKIDKFINILENLNYRNL